MLKYSYKCPSSFDCEREMLALPIRLGDLGIFNPVKSSQSNYQFSIHVTSPLASAILNQLSTSDSSICHQQCILKQQALSIKRQDLYRHFSDFLSTLPSNFQLSLKLAGEKSASSWLSTLPLECHGFTLHKGHRFLWSNFAPLWMVSSEPPFLLCLWQIQQYRTCPSLS